MNLFRGIYRALGFFLGGVWMIFRIALMDLIKGRDLERAIRYRLQFLRWLIPFLGVKLEVIGTPPREPGLLMSDHRSYFDPIPVLRYVWALPVGKAEVRKWPIIGYGGALSGTVYVDRKTKEGRQAARDLINQHLKDGFSILIYPEGTIYPGPELGELKKGMFRDAAKHGYTIHPVALEYNYSADAWLGGKSFPSHFLSRFGRMTIEAKLSFGPSLIGRDEAELLSSCRTWIEKEVIRLREGWFDKDL